jgi:hypothetical protein
MADPLTQGEKEALDVERLSTLVQQRTRRYRLAWGAALVGLLLGLLAGVSAALPLLSGLKWTWP